MVATMVLVDHAIEAFTKLVRMKKSTELHELADVSIEIYRFIDA